ncbi:methylenetetrahydrofolate reductase C-terminal domain-containing protein [Subtercola sp. Z020]|uniref:methylenetetrahydrofolate reductase C-terminal domain-containing protein n=1 Tax=Subtercola sp. Z020 TaxID=2080582 RepID=UPI00268541C8|nr:methylenetetrahydrofolate reductase C-terminal domain-containing protein [Subtercola sp. Z020]
MTTLASEGFSCPKNMEYGPCGGVEFDGSCEVSVHRCVFVDAPVVRWGGAMRGRAEGVGAAGAGAAGDGAVGDGAVGDGAVADGTVADGSEGDGAEGAGGGSAGGAAMRALLGRRPIVVADFPARALDIRSLEACADVLVGRVDAVLAGDSGAERVQFSPTYRASLIQARGLAVFSGLNCRDRNRVAIEGELAGLAAVGVAGVHCVTGDHTRAGGRPDAQPVFDLDSTRVAALAHAAGHLVSVGESPATPPVGERAARLVEKERAGAEVAFVNHAGGVGPVARFVAEVRRLEVAAGLRFVACVPVVVDRGSAELLKTFTTLVLPEGYLDRILGARDVYAEGIAAAVELSRELLGIEGVAGVNLSGGPERGREVAFAEALAAISASVGVGIGGAGRGGS